MKKYRLFYGMHRRKWKAGVVHRVRTSWKFEAEGDIQATEKARERMKELTTSEKIYIPIELRRITEPARDEAFVIVKAL